MTFVPQNSKYKKQFKGNFFNSVAKNININSLYVGVLGLKCLKCGILKSKHFEAIKQSIRKIIKKTGRVIFIKFPQISKTKKSLGIRMGKGKGEVSDWFCKISAGSIICELNTFNKPLGIKALKTAKFRLPIKTKIIFEKY